LRPPCEVVVRSILPAFRSLLARRLIQNYNFSQVDAAKKLGTTQASVSHYLKSKRGEKMVKQLENSHSVQSIADQIAEGIADNKISPLDAMLHFCTLCKTLRSGEIMCEWHKGCLDISESCNVCPTQKKED
jgi:predicted transcriptional regulator